MFLDAGTFGQISAKYGCSAYKLKEDSKLMRINFKDLIDKRFEGSFIFRFYAKHSSADKKYFS